MGDYIRSDADPETVTDEDDSETEETEPSTSGETEGWHEGAEGAAGSSGLACELASLLPLPGASEADNLFAVKVEELQDLPPAGSCAVQSAEVQRLMDGLKGDACSDLVSNFVSDVTTDPVSLDDFLEI